MTTLVKEMQSHSRGKISDGLDYQKQKGSLVHVSKDAAKDECVAIRTLLSELVNTVGAVLTSSPKHVWQVYGGFQRIYEAVKNIFYHGCVHSDSQGNADIWPFIMGLRVLSPVLGPYMESTAVAQPAHEWIQSSLQKLQLAARVSALTADCDYVKKHYQPWALLSSPAHTAAVIKCLQALEENSQAVLAEIDPKLLVGTHWIPMGTPADPSHQKPSGLPKHLLGSHTEEKQTKSTKSKSMAVLPTISMPGQNIAPVLPLQDSKNLSDIRPGNITAPVDINRRGYTFVRGDHPPLCRGKSEASIKMPRREQYQSWDLPSGKVYAEESIGALMSRESPDGSSGSSDWPATSPMSQPLPYVPKDELQGPNINSASTIAKLVHSPVGSFNGSGARPKDLSSQVRSQVAACYKSEEGSYNGSSLRSSISPSLLQVNYGGDNTTSEGEAITHNQHAGLGFRTPQLRRRVGSWRLMSDSDQDSEDPGNSSTPHATRRRRRLTPAQVRPGLSLSVKLLIDSRGVLQGSEGGKYENKFDQEKENLTQESNTSRSEGVIAEKDETLAHSTLKLSDGNEPLRQPELMTVPHAVSTPVNAPHHPDVTDGDHGVAFSAPGRVTKPLSADAKKTKKKTHGRSRSDGAQELVGKLRLTASNTDPTLESDVSKLNLSASKEVLQNPVRKRFMEDGGHSITPAADYGFFPRPQPGQSLIGFLSSKEFHKPYAELDRENAHFNISEAVIAALTQMQFETWQREADSSPVAGEESDEEIRSLQARIREKRRMKLSGSVATASTPATTVVDASSDPQHWIKSQPMKIESTTDYSVCESPQSSTYNSESDLISDLEEEDPSGSFTDRGFEAPVTHSRRTSTSGSAIFKGDLTSAENVALNLLKHFSEQRLPKASELEWLVSEQEAPQKLLPMPTSVAVSPDDNGAAKGSEPQQTQLRGTSEWAPPRPQLILTLHTNTKRSLLMGTQGWRCAGCGMRVSERLSRHFRLCNYLGRYFCTTCHSNQSAVIPAKVLHKWDFKPYPVASFSSELLERMRSDPLFHVGALNQRLYKRCRNLHQIHIYRLQLYYTLPYINTCSRAQSEREKLAKMPQHWANDPHVYSMDDLVAIKGGQVINEIKEVTSSLISHIAKCQVCLGRGFICEICGCGEAIFPFQLDSTALCECCNACFHTGCFSPERCPRCIRRESRRSSHDVVERQLSADSLSSKDS